MPEDTFGPINLRIPASNYEQGELNLEIRDDDRVFIVGANGSGKSALVQHIVLSTANRPTRRISAHRQTWLVSNAIEMTPRTRRDVIRAFDNQDRRPDARWKDDSAVQRISAVLYDLVAAENKRAHEIAELVDEANLEGARSKADEANSPTSRVNELLSAGNLSVQIDAPTREEILAQHVNGEPFSIAQLSDGERAAVILAATVLTVEPGTLLVIDEPERHLHRSIIEPFLTALFASRTDCPFIISTHELSLPVAAPEAKVLLPRSCQWQGDTPREWNIDILDVGDELPDDLKMSVLGSKKRILFVEGDLRSLDAPMYGMLLPDTSVVPKGGCPDVLRAVDGLRAADHLHWVEPYGLVDRDDRSDEQVTELQGRGIFALPVHSAEAIYYSDAAIRRLAQRQAETLGRDVEAMLNAAFEAALTMLSQDETMHRLCARRCHRLVRSSVLSVTPGWEEIQYAADIQMTVPIREPFNEQLNRYTAMIEARDLTGLICRYSVRESGALDTIARGLEFKNRINYQQAVLAHAGMNVEFRDELRALIGPIADQFGPMSIQEAVAEGH